MGTPGCLPWVWGRRGRVECPAGAGLVGGGRLRFELKGQAPKRRGKKNKSLLDTPISELVPSKVLQTSTREIILATALSAIVPTEIPEINFDESLFDLSGVPLNREENDV